MAIADVHGVSANIDGLRTAVENAGGSIKDALIPVMEELAVRFAAPPPESYAASIDELQNSFFLLQAEIGSRLLPVVGESVRALSTLFDALRENDLDALPEPIQAIVRGMQSLFDGFVSVGESIRSGLGPELDLLLPAIGNLLGDILSLAGALLNALAPAYEILAVPTRVAIALIVHLADTIGDVIGEITEFVDWVASLWQEEDRATASTQQLATAQGQLASAAEGARQATEGAAAAAQGASSAYDAWQQRIKDINAELDAHNERLERLQAQYQKNRENGIDPNSRSMLSLARTIETLGGETETFQQRVKDTEGALEALTQKLAQQEAAYQGYISQGSSPLSASMENLARNIKNTESQITALTPAVKENEDATGDVAAATENYSLTLARLRATVEDSRDVLSETIDPQQVEANFQQALQVSDAYYNAQIANAEAALAKEKEGSAEYQKIETDLFNLRRDGEQARSKLTTEATDLREAEEKRVAEVAQDITERRIELAERARAAEVAGFTAAARQGREYAEQLDELVTPSRRQAYIEIVESFQAQGLSLDEARRKAEPYYDLLLTIATPIEAADAAFGTFTSNLVQGANESADSIVSLMNAVNALGTSIATRLPDARGALERAAQREADYFQRNPIGRTIESDQQEAGEQGRRFVGTLFREQDRDAQKAAEEAQRESVQLYNDLSDATVDFTSSLIDLQEETNLADRGFQDFLGTFGRLAAGDYTAILDIPIQLLNLSREAAAERAQGSRDRAVLYQDQLGEFERFGRNLNVASGILGIPESTETRNDLFFDPAANFENVIAQSTADFSDGIKNALLSAVINLERDIRPEDIAAIFQSAIEGLQESLDQTTFDLNFAQGRRAVMWKVRYKT